MKTAEGVDRKEANQSCVTPERSEGQETAQDMSESCPDHGVWSGSPCALACYLLKAVSRDMNVPELWPGTLLSSDSLHVGVTTEAALSRAQRAATGSCIYTCRLGYAEY